MPEPAKPVSFAPPVPLSVSHGANADHVSLRTALAMILADDLEEGLALLDAAIGRAANSGGTARTGTFTACGRS